MKSMDANTKTIKYLALLCRLFIRDNRLTTSNKGALKRVPLSACLERKNKSTNTQLELFRALAI